MEVSNSQMLWHLFHVCVNLALRGRRRINPKARGFSYVQGRILQILSQSDGLSQKELAERLQIRQPSLTGLLLKLEHGGYIKRRQNTSDKRITNIFLTAKGVKTYQKVSGEWREMTDDLFKSLSAEQQTVLAEIFECLIADWTKDDSTNNTAKTTR
jgi:DNA-binding MarR family transcriptional regulator